MKKVNPHTRPITKQWAETRGSFTRRGFLRIGSAAVALAGIVPAAGATDRELTEKSRSDPGPKNVGLDAQNPDSLEMFKSSYYQDFSVSEWLTHTTPELVRAHLRIDQATYDAIPREEPVVMPG